MPETACLHIQAGESDPVRVVDLSSGSVRIGRAAYCDVRLPEADLAEEECQLRRRGKTWQLFPVRPSGSVWLDGLPVDRPSAIPFGVPFRIGEHWLTLRESATSPGPWGLPASSAVAAPDAPEAPAVSHGASLAPNPRDDWQAPSERHDRWLQTHRETQRWESRLRAVGETLRTTEPRPAAPAVPTAAPTPPRDRERSRRADLLRDSFARRPAPSPPSVPRAPTPASAPARPSVYVSPVTPEARPPFRGASDRRAREPEATTAPETLGATGIQPFDPGGETWLADLTAALASAPLETRPTATESTDRAETDLPASAPAVLPPAVSAPPPATVVDDDERFDEAAEPSGQPRLGSAYRVRREDAPAPDPVAPPGSSAEIEPDEIQAVTADREESEERVSPRNIEDGEAEAPPVVAPGMPTRDAGRSGSRQRRSPRRERAASETRSARQGAGGPSGSGPGRASEGREAAGASASPRDWPSVSDILAARGARPVAASPARAAAATPARGPIPTVAKEPGHWRLPLWIGWLPATAAVGVGLAGLAGACAWSVDGYNAGVVARHLAAGESASKSPLPEGVNPGDGSWWKTNASHLVRWAAYLDRDGDDPASAAEVRALLARAGQASPLNPTVRYASAQPTPGESLPPSSAVATGLGQSRDVVALTWAGHQLLAAGKKAAALRAYREALGMAARADLSRPDAPAFLDDPQSRRYALPTEDALAAVIRDMAESTSWTYKEWAAALPRGTAAALAAARVLRDRASGDADAALDAALAEAEHGTAVADPTAEAVRLAAGAAALAMKQRWAQARDRYREAIDLMPADPVRRAWWLNVANVAVRLGEEPERVKALELAKNSDTKDEITQRAVDLQKQAGLSPQRSVARVSGPGEGAAGARP